MLGRWQQLEVEIWSSWGLGCTSLIGRLHSLRRGYVICGLRRPNARQNKSQNTSNAYEFTETKSSFNGKGLFGAWLELSWDSAVTLSPFTKRPACLGSLTFSGSAHLSPGLAATHLDPSDPSRERQVTTRSNANDVGAVSLLRV